MEVWQQVKLHYIGLLVDHHQPELAETFFNSVTTKILHRTLLPQRLHLRAAGDQHRVHRARRRRMPTYRAYYPTRGQRWPTTMARIIEDFDLLGHYADLERDAERVAQAMIARFHQVTLRANFQMQVLSSLFYRNKGAYVVGKIINGFNELPFALPILHDSQGKLYVDAALFGEDELQMLFSFARAYFMVDMEVPVGLCAVPALADAAQAARRDLQRAGPGQAGQDAVLPRLPLPPEALAATSSASRPASRAW